MLTVDWARRQGENVTLGEIDRNLFTRYLGTPVPQPVIPVCTPAQYYVRGQECSTGSITFWNDDGRVGLPRSEHVRQFRNVFTVELQFILH